MTNSDRFLNTLFLLLKLLLLVVDPYLVRAAALLPPVVAVHSPDLVPPLPAEAAVAPLTDDAAHTLVRVRPPGTVVDETHSLDETVTVLDLLAVAVVVAAEEDSQEAAGRSLPEEGTMDGGERGVLRCLCVNGVSAAGLGGRPRSMAAVGGQSRVQSAREVRVVVRGRVRLSNDARVLVGAGAPLGGGVEAGRGVTLGDGVLV